MCHNLAGPTPKGLYSRRAAPNLEVEKVPVKEVELTAIEAKRFTRRGERAQIDRLDQNSSVSMIVPVDDHTSDIEFRFTVTYGAVASIRIEGRMLFAGDSKTLVASWRDKRNMPNEIASEVHTAVMSACIPEAVLLARDLHLPPPIPIPQVKFEQKAQGGPQGGHASYSPEVA